MAKAHSSSDKSSNMPSTWPGAFNVYKYSKQAVMTNLQTLLLLAILDITVGGGFGLIFKGTGSLFNFILGGLFASASILAYLASIKGETISIKEALSKALDFWLRMLGLYVVIALSLVGSLLLFIVPFFFVLPRLILANYFLIDRDMGVMEAYKASWHAAKGHSSKVWGVIGANIAMALLMITIIGIPFAVYFLFMYSAALALLYKHIAGQHRAAAKAN